MDIVWLSANRFGYELLKESKKIKSKDINIKAIVTLSDKATTKMYDKIERKKWDEFGINVFEIQQVNEESVLLESLSPDLILMCGWRQKINKNIIDIPKNGIVGFHPTLLPIGRGSAPIINSILEGFKKSGVTMFYIGEGFDDGDIIGQEEFTIDETDCAGVVYDKVIESGRKLVFKYVPLLSQGISPRIAQDNSMATIFEKRNLQGNRIDLEKDTIDEIFRKIRAFSKPYNGAYIEKNKEKIIIWKAELVK